MFGLKLLVFLPKETISIILTQMGVSVFLCSCISYSPGHTHGTLGKGPLPPFARVSDPCTCSLSDVPSSGSGDVALPSPRFQILS